MAEISIDDADLLIEKIQNRLECDPYTLAFSVTRDLVPDAVDALSSFIVAAEDSLKPERSKRK